MHVMYSAGKHDRGLLFSLSLFLFRLISSRWEG